MRILDVGCGIRKQPGSIGLDRNPASRADVLADLDRCPYPFADGSFDRLTAIHVVEHLSDEDLFKLHRGGHDRLALLVPQVSAGADAVAIGYSFTFHKGKDRK